jgi:predicted metalloendopeptidase
MVLYDKQKEQLAQLVSMANSLKEQTAVLDKKMSAINDTDELLSQRTASVLEASRALLPKITEKELEYFTQLKRWEKQCDVWEEKLTAKQRVVDTSITPLITIELSDTHRQMCHVLLAGQEVLLSKNKDRLDDLETKVKQLIATNGLKQQNKRLT